MGLSQHYLMDDAKENGGIEVRFEEAINADGSVPTFIVARMGKTNKAYSKGLEAATRPFRRQMELGTMDNAKAEAIFLDVFATFVLKGWKNIPMSDVTGIADERADCNYADFSKANAVLLLKRLPEVYDRLQDEAKASANFREEGLEADAKN